MAEQQYVGFWARFAAVVVNTIILGVILAIALPLFGVDFGAATDPAAMEAMIAKTQVPSLLLELAFFVGVWVAMQTDPGKMLFGAVIVDAKTGGKPSVLQFVLRYIGYIISALPLCLGFMWVAFDARKQGFHDKIAGTVVVKKGRQEA